MSYNKNKQFNDGKVLAAADLNQLIEGINGSVTNISLGTDNVTLTITKNDGESETITLPSEGGNGLTVAELLDALVNEFNNPTKTLTDTDKQNACEWLGACEKLINNYGDTDAAYIIKKDNSVKLYPLGAANGIAIKDAHNRVATSTAFAGASWTIALNALNAGDLLQFATKAKTISELQLTDDQKADWREWLGIDTLIGEISTLLNTILDLEETTTTGEATE